MDVSVGGWWSGGCMDGRVSRWVVFGCMCGWMSVSGWWLGSCMDGRTGSWVVVAWMYDWMCR